jgi:hypothetical protein
MLLPEVVFILTVLSCIKKMILLLRRPSHFTLSTKTQSFFVAWIVENDDVIE